MHEHETVCKELSGEAAVRYRLSSLPLTKKKSDKGHLTGNIRRFVTSNSCVWLAIGLVSCNPSAYAVVGMAERYDEFKEKDLEQFHQSLTAEEDGQQRERSLDIMETVKFPSTEQQQDHDKELESLKKELLRLPNRDRFKLGLDGQYTFDSNILRAPPRQSNSESSFDTNGFTLFDFGGKKTDLRFEVRSGKQWNIQFPKSDFWTVEERIRYRRKYFKKITHSAQSRIARHSSKTVEIDEKKIRWDSQQNSVFNYAFSRKFSTNLELDANKRLYTTEPFDQDSQWQATASPSFFWHITPKSRVSLGYRFGASRIRTKTGDTNTHEVSLAYFGKVTRKSSVSFDGSFSHQTPRSEDTGTVNTYKIGLGYIWQMTPKTQVVVQAIRSIQNTSSNQVGETDTATKSDQSFTNDSFNVSLNSRLTRKLTAIVGTGVAHVKNDVGQGGDENLESRQITFPTVFTANYDISKWLQMRVQYTFAFRTGNEKADTYRTHALMSGVNMNF